jgi:hypothetical protein
MLCAMSIVRPFLWFAMILSGWGWAAEPNQGGERLLTSILQMPWTAPWRQAELAPARLVQARKGTTESIPLPDVWHAAIRLGDRSVGYLQWSTDLQLEDLVLEGDMADDPQVLLIRGVPDLQQFPIPRPGTSAIASGCVPTAGATLIGYWIDHGFPMWRGPDSEASGLMAITSRLRARMPMVTIPDTDGFTDNGMDLAGAYEVHLAASIRTDASAAGLRAKAVVTAVDPAALRAEIGMQRPVVLCGVLRVPHRPGLAWGHAVVGVGIMRMCGREMVGIRDNFLPAAPQTIRWVPIENFSSMMQVIPEVP